MSGNSMSGKQCFALYFGCLSILSRKSKKKVKNKPL